MAVSVEIATDKDATTWVDLAGAIRLSSLRMGGQAADGQAGAGFGFDFEDPAAAYELPSRRVVRLSVGSTVLARGRVVEKALHRPAPPVGDARSFDVSLSDGNAHLQGIPVHLWERPEETDIERITALAATFLAGSPRPSTNLATTWISSDNPVTLPEQRYDATNPAGVVSDIVGVTGKLFFVTVDDEIFYADHTSTDYAATISVTDQSPNLDTEFPPIWTGSAGVQDGTELYSGLRLLFGAEGGEVWAKSADAETDHDYWEEVIGARADTADAALTELTALLDARSREELRVTFSLLLPESAIGSLKYGQVLEFRAAAAGVLESATLRAARVTWSSPTPGLWLASVEGGFVRKVTPRLTRGLPTTSPASSTPFVPVYQGCFYDNFDRTVAPNELGTSTSGQEWEVVIDPADASAGVAVSVAHGAATIFCPSISLLAVPGGREMRAYVTFATAPSGHATIQIDFEFYGPNMDGEPLPYIEPVARFAWSGSSDWFAILDIRPHTMKLITPINTGSSWSGQVTRDEVSLVGYGRHALQLDIEPNAYVRASLNGGGVVQWHEDPMPAGPISFSFVIKGAAWNGGATTGDTFANIYSISMLGCQPASGQPVTLSVVGLADGGTTNFGTYPYVPGSLRVYVDGIDWTSAITETSPGTGQFTFNDAPADGDTIAVSYIRA